jgi:hypothetical protein
MSGWCESLMAPEVILNPEDREHVVQFYDDDIYFVDLVARFLGVGLVASEPVVAVLTETHRHAVCERLLAVGFDIDAAVRDGQLHFEDAHKLLDRLMADGMPDADRVRILVGGFLREIEKGRYGRKRTRVFGEMVDILWHRGDEIAAVRMEELWNGLQFNHPFHLLCAYCMDCMYRETHATSVEQIHRAHTRVLASPSH